MKEYSFGSKCMGTRLEVSIITNCSEKAQDIWEKVQYECIKAEHIFSRFIPTSELSKINQGESVSLSPWFIEVFALAQEAFAYTSKTFNPLCSPYFFGYTEDFEQKKFSPEKPITNTSFQDILFDKEKKTILLPPSCFLDFGGIIKGWLAEKLAKQFANQLHGIIISIGGDMAAYGKDLHTDTFLVNILNPITQQHIPIRMHHEVLCTSGTYKRYWNHHHHIIDPFILSSAKSDLISASIIHEHGHIAESLSTACIIWGKQKSIDFLEAKKIKYVLIEN